MIIIGITGTNGAGKGTIVDYLVKNKGFLHFSSRGVLTEMLKEKALEPSRENLIDMGNELRAKNGPSALAELLFEKAVQSNQNCIIESIRTLGEIDALRNKENFYLLAVDADSKIRYERVVGRGSSTDTMSFEKFIELEKGEMESSDPTKQNILACVNKADFVLTNNGNFEELHKQIEEILGQISIVK